MNKRILVIPIFIALFLIPLVAAEGSFIYKQDKSSSIDLPIYDQNFAPLGICTANLTVTQPITGKVVVNNQAMTCANGRANYTLTATDNNNLGDYDAAVSFCSGGNCGFTTFSYTVTPSGFTGILGLTIIVMLAVYGVAFFGFFGKNVWVAMLGGMAMIILGLYLINNGIDIYRNLMTDALSWVTIGLGAIFTLTSGASVINDNM